jgi:tRNA(Ile)-lysidine synthase
MLLTTVKEIIRKYSLLTPGDRVLVAVSGGPDSVCLLNVLHTLTRDFGLSLHVAHLDHMFRAKESADEALFVADLARTLGVPATIEQIDVPAFCHMRGLSSQAGAREVRYEFLTRVALETKADRIATGHTASDQAETFLMRLLRGAGRSGLSAIPPKRENIIRPLINSTREEVLAYLRTNGIAFKTDPSNAKPLYTRNRVRLELMPILKQFNPRIEETLATEAGLLRDEDIAIDGHLESIAQTVFVQEETALTIRQDVFQTQPHAFQLRLLRKALSRMGAGTGSVSSIQCDEIIAFMTAAQTGRSMRLPQGLAIERVYDRFIISMQERVDAISRDLTVPGVTIVPELNVVIELNISGSPLDEIGETENYRWQAMFDYDKIATHLTLRNRRPGDWFCPSGMNGSHKKLQDFLVDRKVPRRDRYLTPLLCSGNDIVWVIGLRTDERFLAGPDTKKVMVVRVNTLGVSCKV